MKRILIVFPTAWDRRHLAVRGTAWRDRYAVEFATPTDEDCPAQFDIQDFVARSIRAGRARLDGVTSSSDYPGAVVAAAIATELGLPGARPEAILRCSHKFYAREAQRAAVPDAVPAFTLVDPSHPSSTIGFPCFVKPVKGAFSVLSSRIESQAELAEFLGRPCVQEFTTDYLHIFNDLLKHYVAWEHDARYFIAEQVLLGDQVTVEGYVCGGQVEILGIVDSVMHPGTRSFARFEYPSSLPAEVQARMAEIARRAARGLGLDNTLFNTEMMYDAATGRVWIIEINPRMCGQFADLYDKVDGTNGYEVALALAAGERPVVRRDQGRYRFAASFPLRVFDGVRVERAPDADDVHAAEALFPGTLVWLECEAGQSLCDFEALEDGCSSRYGVVNLGAPDRESLVTRLEAVQSRLGFAFAPLPVGQPSAAR